VVTLKKHSTKVNKNEHTLLVQFKKKPGIAGYFSNPRDPSFLLTTVS
jgi:hypothetical protein